MENLSEKNYLEKLPEELKIMTMRKLTKHDLCSVALVSKNLRNIALDPSLWPELTINQYIMEKLERDPAGVDALLKLQTRWSKIKTVKIGDLSTKRIGIELLTRLIPKVEKVDLSGIPLPYKQVQIILVAILNSNSIIELNLGVNGLNHVPTELLTKVFIKLKKVDMVYSFLRTRQLNAILEETINSSTLNDLTLRGNGLEKVPAEVIAKAVSKLKKVNLENTSLTTEQLVAIFNEISNSKSLVELNLQDNILKDVPAKVIVKAVSKLKKLNLQRTLLSNEQLVNIFEEAIGSNSLIDLNLGYNDLANVPEELLFKAVSKLKKIDLSSASLSTEQLTIILKESVKSNRLVALNLAYNQHLDDLPTQYLSDALMVFKLKNVQLHSYFELELRMAIDI